MDIIGYSSLTQPTLPQGSHLWGGGGGGGGEVRIDRLLSTLLM